MAGKVMIGEDTGRDDDPRSRCSLIGSDVGVYIFNYCITVRSHSGILAVAGKEDRIVLNNTTFPTRRI